MNIAIISNEFPPNVRAGLGRYAERITKYLLQEDHNLWVFTANPGDLPQHEGTAPLTIFRPIRRWLQKPLLSNRLNRSRFFEITLITLNVLLYSIDSFFLVRKLNKKTRFDVIAFHDTTSSPIAGILSKLFTKIPVVFHVHSTETTMTPWAIVKDPFKIIAAMERWLARLADKIIVLSPEQVTFLVQHGWDAGKIISVPHGYDNESFLNVGELPPSHVENKIAEIHERLGIVEGQPVIIFVGRLVAVKGIHTLIKAMKKVAVEIPEAKLVILGEGKGRGKDIKVDTLIHELQLEGNIYAYHRFLDSQEVMWHTLLADICVFPSLYEPFGLVAVEAMSLGKPVILGHGFSRLFAGDDPDHPTAWFANGNDADDLAQKMIDLLQDPETQHRMGQSARQFVKHTFRWEKTVNETIQVYQEAIQENDKRDAI